MDEIESTDAGRGLQAPAPLERELTKLQHRIARARPGDTRSGAGSQAADLVVAYEEMLAAADELRAQQRQIDQLDAAVAHVSSQHERMFSTLPVAALTTDGAGIIRTANPAAAGLTDTRVARLAGKPVMTLFSLDDRPRLRKHISAQTVDGATFQHQGTLVTRHGATIGVDVTATVLSPAVAGSTALVSWVLLETARHDRSAPSAVSASVAQANAARDRLPGVLVRLAGLSATSENIQDLLTRAVTLCEVALGDEVALSITLGAPDQPGAIASTATLAQHIDGLQLRLDEGPCVDAYHQDRTVTTEDVHHDPRWPAIAQGIPPSVGAVVATSLRSAGRRVGALNVYRSAAGTDAAFVESVELLAMTLSALLQEFELRQELRSAATDMERALASRAIIDQAKGIVMADLSLSAEEAFAHLVDLASAQEMKVRDVARLLVERHGGPVSGAG